jgi:hypothetical protein
MGGEVGPSKKGIGFYFIRILVTNSGRRDEAEDVDVSIGTIAKVDGNAVDELKDFVPANLRWSNTWDLADAGRDKAGVAEVLVKNRISARGGQRLCDLGFIVDPERLKDFCEATSVERSSAALPYNQVLFLLALEYIRPWPPRSLEPGQYWLELLCDARRMKPKSFWVRLNVPTTFTLHQVPGGFEVECRNQRPSELRS